MTHTQAYILSRLTVSRDHTRKQLYPNNPTPRYQHLCDVALPLVTSNLPIYVSRRFVLRVSGSTFLSLRCERVYTTTTTTTNTAAAAAAATTTTTTTTTRSTSVDPPWLSFSSQPCHPSLPASIVSGDPGVRLLQINKLMCESVPRRSVCHALVPTK